MKNGEDIHNCPLRNKNIDDGECFETVMAILGMHSIEFKKKYTIYIQIVKISAKIVNIIKKKINI